MSAELITSLLGLAILLLKMWINRTDNKELMKQLLETQKQLDLLAKQMSNQQRTVNREDQPKVINLEDQMDSDFRAGTAAKA